MSDEAIDVLGLNLKWARPEWLLITVFPVPPPHVRPSVVMDGSQRSDDDLTHQVRRLGDHHLCVYNQLTAQLVHHMNAYSWQQLSRRI